ATRGNRMAGSFNWMAPPSPGTPLIPLEGSPSPPPKPLEMGSVGVSLAPMITATEDRPAKPIGSPSPVISQPKPSVAQTPIPQPVARPKPTVAQPTPPATLPLVGPTIRTPHLEARGLLKGFGQGE